MISELIDAVASWRSLVVVLLVWGFLPRLVLRLILLAYRKDDPRRAEYMAESYVIPVAQRPLWVAEILELAISEGLRERLADAWFWHWSMRWRLRSGVRANRDHPDTFWIPSQDERDSVQPGDDVKLMFQLREGWGERMWVHVELTRGDRLRGTLVNSPLAMPRLEAGDEIRFRRHHIIDVVDCSGH